MARKIANPPITEPVIVDCMYSTGATVERIPHAVHFVFWVHTPEIRNDDGEYEAEYIEDTGERRIVARLAMPVDAARVFAKSIVRALRDVGHRRRTLMPPPQRAQTRRIPAPPRFVALQWLLPKS